MRSLNATRKSSTQYIGMYLQRQCPTPPPGHKSCAFSERDYGS